MKIKRPRAPRKPRRPRAVPHLFDVMSGSRRAANAAERKSSMSKLPKLRAKPTKELVALMQMHSPAALAGVFHNPDIKPGTIKGSLMGFDEYANAKEVDPRRPWQYTVADYCVRQRPGKFDPDAPWGIYLRKFNVCLAQFTPNSFALRDALARMFDAAHARKQSEIAKFKDARPKLPKIAKFKDARPLLPKRHVFRYISDGD